MNAHAIIATEAATPLRSSRSRTIAALLGMEAKMKDLLVIFRAEQAAGEPAEDLLVIANDLARQMIEMPANTPAEVIAKLRAVLWVRDLPDLGDVELREDHHTNPWDGGELEDIGLFSLALDLRRLDRGERPASSAIQLLWKRRTDAAKHANLLGKFADDAMSKGPAQKAYEEAKEVVVNLDAEILEAPVQSLDDLSVKAAALREAVNATDEDYVERFIRDVFTIAGRTRNPAPVFNRSDLD